jgi:hypothetical protein
MWKGVRETGADRQDISLCARGPGSAISVQAIQQTLSYRVASPMFGPASAGTCTDALCAQPRSPDDMNICTKKRANEEDVLLHTEGDGCAVRMGTDDASKSFVPSLL